ncbi:hypothetical protein FGO68_gene1751 [Halteria grandinella]|uniref:AIG1-type G domain-containing protein n=1 Tax=Halteria grandinella TaxID=5974 RepID=A0A8J8T3Z2_HALGN|nr:hypothetical protein FGO68_gene1751 [Halteria grandinella]
MSTLQPLLQQYFVQMEHKLRPLTIIPFGAPGVGKSNVLNVLIGKLIFVSNASAASGVTRIIRSETGFALGVPTSIKLTVYDAPGVGDLQISIQQMILDLEGGIGKTVSFDVTLMVFKASDTRITIQEIMALKAMKAFFDNFLSKKVLCVITHCDKVPVTEPWIAQKLQMFNKYSGIQLGRDQVILFSNTSDSLKPLVQKLAPSGDMRVKTTIQQEGLRLMSELPNDFAAKAQNEGGKMTLEELKQVKQVQQQHEEMKKKIEDGKVIEQKLRQQLAQPKIVIIQRPSSGACN